MNDPTFTTVIRENWHAFCLDHPDHQSSVQREPESKRLSISTQTMIAMIAWAMTTQRMTLKDGVFLLRQVLNNPHFWGENVPEPPCESQLWTIEVPRYLVNDEGEPRNAEIWDAFLDCLWEDTWGDFLADHPEHYERDFMFVKGQPTFARVDVLVAFSIRCILTQRWAPVAGIIQLRKKLNGPVFMPNGEKL